MYHCVSHNKSQLYFTNPKSWVSWALIELHDYVMFFLINVLIIVLVYSWFSLIYHRKYRNDKEAIAMYLHFNIKKFTHAPLLEFGWTFIPIILLFLMGWPSFKLLYAVEQLIDPYHTVIIIGNQWYWTYQYADFDVVSEVLLRFDDKETLDRFKRACFKTRMVWRYGIFNEKDFFERFNDKDFLQVVAKTLRREHADEAKLIYDCLILPDEDLPFGYPRMLSTDQVLVLPAGVSVRLLITSTDVIHSWSLPALGYKMDAIPGRLNQISFLAPFWGTYRGQCSELCGINHGYMPIEVRVVPVSDYLDYIKLSMSFKLDLFVPLLHRIFKAYIIHDCDYLALPPVKENVSNDLDRVVDTLEKKA